MQKLDGFLKALTDLAARIEPDSVEELLAVLNADARSPGPQRNLSVAEYVETVFLAPALASVISFFLAQNQIVADDVVRRVLRDAQKQNNISDAVFNEYIALLENTFDPKEAVRNGILARVFASHVKYDRWVTRGLAIIGSFLLAWVFTWIAHMAEFGVLGDPFLLLQTSNSSYAQMFHSLVGELSARHVSLGVFATTLVLLFVFLTLAVWRRLLVARRTKMPNNATLIQVSLILSQVGLHSGYLVRVSRSGAYFTLNRVFGKPVIAVPEQDISRFHVAHEGYHVLARDFRSPTRLPQWVFWGSLVFLFLASLPVGIMTDWQYVNLTAVPLWPLLFCFIWFDRLCELRADYFASLHFAVPAGSAEPVQRSSWWNTVKSFADLQYPSVQARLKYVALPARVEFSIFTQLAICCLAFSVWHIAMEGIALFSPPSSGMDTLDAVGAFNYPFATFWLVFLIRQSKLLKLSWGRAISHLALYFVISAMFPLVWMVYVNEVTVAVAQAPTIAISTLVRNQLQFAVMYLAIMALIIFPVFGSPRVEPSK